MTGWNMPPGCNVSDIPGNTREDQETEVLYEAIYSVLETAGVEPNDALAEVVAGMINQAYHDGYKACFADMAEEGKE